MAELALAKGQQGRSYLLVPSSTHLSKQTEQKKPENWFDGNFGRLCEKKKALNLK